MHNPNSFPITHPHEIVLDCPMRHCQCGVCIAARAYYAKQLDDLDNKVAELTAELAVAWSDCPDGTCHACAKCYDRCHEMALINLNRK